MILSIDTETNGLNLRHSARPFFTTICFDDNTTLYWEWDVDPLTRKPDVPREDLLEIVQHLDEADEIVAQNSDFDITSLTSVGLKWKDKWWKKVQDTTYGDHLLASDQPRNLTSQALRYLHIDIEPLEAELEKAIKDCRKIAKREFPNWLIAKAGLKGFPSIKDEAWRNDYWLPRAIAKAKKLPLKHPYWTVLSDYANVDSGVTLPIWLKQKQMLKEQGLWGLYQERRKLIQIVFEMESRGITFSETRRKELIGRLQKEELETEKICIGLSGGILKELPKNGTTKELRKVIFERFKLPPMERKKKKTKTELPSIDKDALEFWSLTLDQKSAAFKFVDNLQKNRIDNTAIGFSESYVKFGIDVRGSEFVGLHPSFNATGSSTLRFTSSNPNGQQISKKKQANLRYLFGPMPGRVWCGFDYSNLELTIPAYEADEREMIQLFERPDDAPYFGSQHLLIAHVLYPKQFEECLAKGEDFKTKYKDTIYQWVKNGNFAVTYGAIEESGTADSAYHLPGAQRKIKERFKKLAKLNEYWVEFANKNGYVTTMVDKTIGAGYPIQASRTERGEVRPTTPLNYHVQGTAGWVMCKAMIRVRDYLNTLKGAYLTLQVHDELIVDFEESHLVSGNYMAIMEIKRLMELSGKDIGVPLKVEYAYHRSNWSEETEIQLQTSL